MRSQAARDLRSSNKYWSKLREELVEAARLSSGSSEPLLQSVPQGGPSSRSIPGGQSDGFERGTSSFFEQHFNAGSGAGFRKAMRQVSRASSNGRLASSSLDGGGSANTPPNKWWSPRSDSVAIWNLLFSSYINVLLLLCPLGVLAHKLNWGAAPVFLLNFAGIIPLALIIGDVTEDLALRSGDIVGGLVNATFGNIVELIISMVALSKKSEAMNQVAGMSNLGSILSNLLLVLGCCFFFGGLKNKVQKFNALANQVCNSLLFLAVIAIVLPLAAKNFPDLSMSDGQLLHFSRITAIFLAIAYLAYLYFQLISHHDIFSGVSQAGEGDDEDDEPALTVTAEVLLLFGISMVVATQSELITGSIEDMSKSSGLSANFLSIIMLPVAGNAVEHITAVMMAMRNKMDLALGIALGSSIQIAIFVLPSCVLASWAMGNPFSLVFNSLGTIAIVLAAIHANFITTGGTSHWLMGVQLIGTYLLIATAFLYT